VTRPAPARYEWGVRRRLTSLIAAGAVLVVLPATLTGAGADSGGTGGNLGYGGTATAPGAHPALGARTAAPRRLDSPAPEPRPESRAASRPATPGPGGVPRPTLRVGSAGPGVVTIRLPGGRGYVLHPRTGPAAVPLVVLLPGLFETWLNLASSGGWSRYADQHGFAVVYGIGVGESWNAGSCCGTAQRDRVDDVSYLVDVVHDAELRESIDPTRVYVLGFSNGDMMAVRAECDRPEVFAAAGGSSGAPVAPCDSPVEQVRVRHLHGRYDTTVPYAGGYSTLTGTSFPPVARFAALIQAGSPGAVVAVSTLPCSHQWPRTDDACRVNGTDLLWRWLSRYRRPPPAAPARTRQPLL
jgi:dienelactone hydrolase